MIAGFAGWLSVLLLAVLIGDRWVRIVANEIDPWLRVVTSFVAGFLALGLLGQLLTAVSIPWSRFTLVAASIALVASIWRSSTSLPLAAGKAKIRTRWPAVVVVFLPVFAFAWSSFSMRSPFADFVYHWGPKAKRFVLAGGMDFAFLAAIERRYMHADYPNLFPELLAFSSIFGGVFEESVLLLWSVLFVALLVVVAWWGLLDCEDVWLAHIAWFAVSVSVCAFAIGHYLGGSPDPGIALAALLGGVLLQRRRILEVAGALGVVAAFATLLKFEGALLGALLVILGAIQGWRFWRRKKGRLLSLVGLPLLAAAAWLLPIARYDLWKSNHRGVPDLDHLPAILETLGRASSYESWRALPYLLLLTPLLLLSRKTRWLASVALLMLGFDAYVYLASPVDVEFLILASFPRLALHVLPLVLVGLFVLFDRFLTRLTNENMSEPTN